MTRSPFNTHKPFTIMPDILLINIKFAVWGIHFVVWCGFGGGRGKVRTVINACRGWMGWKRL